MKSLITTSTSFFVEMHMKNTTWKEFFGCHHFGAHTSILVSQMAWICPCSGVFYCWEPWWVRRQYRRERCFLALVSVVILGSTVWAGAVIILVLRVFAYLKQNLLVVSFIYSCNFIYLYNRNLPQHQGFCGNCLNNIDVNFWINCCKKFFKKSSFYKYPFWKNSHNCNYQQ